MPAPLLSLQRSTDPLSDSTPTWVVYSTDIHSGSYEQVAEPETRIVEPARLTVTIHGWNTGDNLIPGDRFRLVAGTDTIFTGVLERFRIHGRAEDRRLPARTLECVGILSALAQRTVRAPWTQAVRATRAGAGPKSWYSLGTPETALGSLIPDTVGGLSAVWGTDGGSDDSLLPGYDGDGAARLRVGTLIGWPVEGTPGSGSPWTWSGWVDLPPPPPTGAVFDLATSSAPSYAAGWYAIQATTIGGTWQLGLTQTLTGGSTVTWSCDHRLAAGRHQLAVVGNPGDPPIFYVDGGVRGTVGGNVVQSLAQLFDPFSYYEADTGAGDVGLDEVMWWPTADIAILGDLDDLWEAAKGRSGERAGARLAWALDIGDVNIAAGDEPLDAVRHDMTQQEIVRLCAATEFGSAYSAGDTLVFFTAAEIAAKTLFATFSDTPGVPGIGFMTADYVVDGGQVRNRALVTAAGSTVEASTGAGDRSLAVETWHTTAGAARNLAGTLVNTYSSTHHGCDGLSWRPHLDDTWATALALWPFDRVRLVRSGPWIVTDDHFLVYGVRHDWGPERASWVTTLQIRREGAAQEWWKLGTGELGDASGPTTTALGY